ncbi:tripartite motif-containing protein 2-like [Mytilus edulis]|uniref:tripartite motif-containing protein 2-like n=1 Tax=Mytilus edulis TaxID=6550 RepID=UPI0039F0D10D
MSTYVEKSNYNAGENLSKQKVMASSKPTLCEPCREGKVNNMTINIETKIKINVMKKPISDMICLMDGRILVVEWYGKVYQLTSNGKLDKQLKIPGEASNVTQINQDTIAINYPSEKVIKIFNMKNKRVTKVIKLDSPCWGLSFSNNSLAVSLFTGEIRIIDLEGNILRSIVKGCDSTRDFLVYCNDRVIYSDRYGKAVYCINASGQQIWQYTQDLEGPKGLCTDNYGNIIVADYESDRIIVISKDGQNSKVLINKEDGLENPHRICFNRNASSCFTCHSWGSYLAEFDITYG